MPPTGARLSPTGQRVYTNITFTAPSRQPGDEYPPALREIVERAAERLLSHEQRLECERELAGLRLDVTCRIIQQVTA